MGVLGVDIGAAAVQAAGPVRVRRVPPSGVLRHGPVASECRGGGQFRDVEAVGEAIRQALSGWRGRPKPAAAALAAACVRTKAFEVDAALTDEEIEALIVVEAERHLPLRPSTRRPMTSRYRGFANPAPAKWRCC